MHGRVVDRESIVSKEISRNLFQVHYMCYMKRSGISLTFVARDEHDDYIGKIFDKFENIRVEITKYLIQVSQRSHKHLNNHNQSLLSLLFILFLYYFLLIYIKYILLR